ncbi:hypothetical protein Moror_4045 [Moniliophthora roreri MCA 2997]|uniref:Uncharacterized protein n=1 Tax=Moniliophthora roreri (strain MCA 2997) TaxID=1381753 RepID=V2WV99_MONRO|nr:hypothetical protein Moror_4045 [Moniliophthora roreri MCA 2997]
MMRFISFLSLAATSFVAVSATPLPRSADFVVGRIKIINDTNQISVRFMRGFVDPGHENEPVPTFNWLKLATLDPGESQDLPLGSSGLSRFAIYNQIPEIGCKCFSKAIGGCGTDKHLP